MSVPMRESAQSYRSPECRSTEHQMCAGSRREIRLPGQLPYERPVEVLSCACKCHRPATAKALR